MIVLSEKDLTSYKKKLLLIKKKKIVLNPLIIENMLRT